MEPSLSELVRAAHAADFDRFGYRIIAEDGHSSWNACVEAQNGALILRFILDKGEFELQISLAGMSHPFFRNCEVLLEYLKFPVRDLMNRPYSTRFEREEIPVKILFENHEAVVNLLNSGPDFSVAFQDFERARQQRWFILQDLISFRSSLADIVKSLAGIEGLPRTRLVFLGVTNVENTLLGYIEGDVSAQDVVDWANIVARREDVGYEYRTCAAVKEIVQKLSDPALAGRLTSDMAQAMILSLKGAAQDDE